MIRNSFRVLLVLWAGSLWSTLWVATILFRVLRDPHVAGQVAGRLFAIESYLGVAVAVLASLLPRRGRFLWVYAAAALLAVNQGILTPLIATARLQGSAAGLTFGAWHGVSSVIYLIACCAVLAQVWRQDIG